MPGDENDEEDELTQVLQEKDDKIAELLDQINTHKDMTKQRDRLIEERE